MKSAIVRACAGLLMMTTASLAQTVLTNQIGYEPAGPKQAVVLGHAGDDVTAWRLLDSAGHAVANGQATNIGPVAKWKDWVFWSIDFGAAKEAGQFTLECDTPHGPVRSFPFLIQSMVLERNTLADVVYYFRCQRIVGQQDIADHHLKFEGDTDPNHTLDLHGGWGDATGDAGKHLSHLSFASYFNPQHGPLTTWALLKSHTVLQQRGDKNFRQINRKILDEGIYGADYLARSKAPGGSFFRSVDDPGTGLAEDRFVAKDGSGGIFGKLKNTNPLQTGDLTRISPTFAYEISFRAGGAMSIAALALASRQEVAGDYTSAQYLQIAEEAFAFLQKNNLVYTNDGKVNIIDDYTIMMAATELFSATKKAEYKTSADEHATNLIARLTPAGYWRAGDDDRPFFHASDAGLPVVALLNYCDIADETQKAAVLAAVQKSLQHDLDITAAVPNAFGYARQFVQGKDGTRRETFFFPHDSGVAPWWQGENARLASLAAAARMAAPHFKDDAAFHGKLEQFASNQLSWILGCNPFDVCMLRGVGRTNPQYIVDGTWQYVGAPGGIANGITAGLHDPDGIDFNPTDDPKAANDTWRWDEQWLPHSTWYLLAVSEGVQ